jgi:hypothetical protein
MARNRELFAGFSAEDMTTMASLLSRFLDNLDASEDG